MKSHKLNIRLLQAVSILALFFYTTTGFAGNINLKEIKILDGQQLDNSAAETNSSQAEEPTGKITIKPMFIIGSRYDSNFYKTETDETAIYKYFIQPGILLGYETGKSKISFQYLLSANFYNKNEGSYIGHDIIFSGRNQPSPRLTVGLDDSFYWTRDPVQADKFSDGRDTEPYAVNRFSPMVKYQFGEKFSAGLRYQHTMISTDRADEEDSSEHRGIFNLIYNFNPKTSLDLEYQRWARSYDRTTPDYTSDQLQLIFAKQFNYITVEAGTGYHKRRFDNTWDDSSALSYRFAVTGQNPPAPDARRSYIRFAAEQNFNDPSSGGTYFKVHQLTLSAGHIIREKILTSIEGKYKKKDYKNWIGSSGHVESREDDVFGISAGVGYLINDYLTCNFGLGYESQDSDAAGYDYDNTFFQLSLDSRYDFAGGKESEK